MAHYFLAIKIPSELQSFYHTWQKELQNTLPYKKWTAREDLHITLCFLGEASKEQIEKLVSRLESVPLDQSFRLTLGGLDGFGRLDRPRVLFVGVDAGNMLHDLQEQVVKATAEVGFKREKRAYIPHVTLAKKWATAEAMPEGKFKELQSRYGMEQSFEVSDFTLYKIHPQQVPSYEPVKIFPLIK